MVGFEDSSVMAVSGTTVEATECDSAENPTEPPLEMLPVKKKRNLPGNPDRDAEVIALSPKSLVATNRFVCEICNKGFQRDQNLQLHRRGHNLPWKLKQRTGKEIRKRVYICPEKTCVHHDPLRALGDLTGIKKHFSRKHGEKKWKCERCTKKYAVQSDWKAHMKICGSKEYRCDCGSLFSRRDSFITHRAFCDALAHESTRTQSQTLAVSNSDQTLQQSTPIIMEAVVLPTTSCSPPPPPPLTPSTDVLSPAISFQTPELPENAMVVKGSGATTATTTASTATTTVSGGSTSNSTSVFPSIYATSSITIEPMSLSLSSSLYSSNTGNQSIFPSPENNLLHKLHHRYLPVSQPALSATALLQKAAQMGAKSSNTSFLHALGLASPSPSSAGGNYRQDTNNGEWSNVHHIKQEGDDNFRLGLGIPFATATATTTTTTTTSLTDLMMGPPAPTTLDFLGLGMGGGNGGSSGGFSAYLASTGSGFHGGAGAASAVPLFRGINSGGNKIWDDSDDRKPDHL